MREFIDEMKAFGIGTSVHFVPLQCHPYYAREYGYKTVDFPHAQDSYSRCLLVPIYPDMSRVEMERVSASVKAVVQRSLKSRPIEVTR